MHNHYFGIASVLFATAGLIWSIGQALAIPMGPNISLGQNPVFAVQSTGYTGTLFTNNTSSTAVVTDLVVVASYACNMNFSVSNGGDAFRILASPQNGSPGQVSLQSGIKIPAGETLEFSGNHSSYCAGASASGYYAH